MKRVTAVIIKVKSCSALLHMLLVCVRSCLIAECVARGLQTKNMRFNLLKPTGHVMHQQFNIQQLYALPTLYLRVLYLSEDKQRLVPLTA